MTATNTGRRVFLVGTLIDGTGKEPIRDAAVLVEGERITAVGPRASVAYDPQTTEVVDASSQFAIPGLIDSHSHIINVGDVSYKGAHVVFQVAKGAINALATLQMGVTTIRDVGGPMQNINLHFREAINAGLIEGPRMFTSGSYITATAGFSGVTVTAIEVDGPIEARRAARRQLGAGADLLKIFATSGIGGNGHSRSGRTAAIPPHLRRPRATTGGIPWCQMTVEEMSVVVEEAHKVKATVACHAIGIEGIRNALAAGIDTLEHGTGMDDAAIETMIKQNVTLVPTMSILHTIAYHGKDWDYPPYAMDNARHHYERHVVAVGRAREAGVKIAAGTDVIDNDTVAMECAQLVKAGFTPMEAVVAATRTGAEILNKEHDFGTVQVGRRADLVLLGANPLADIKHLEDVRMVVKDGRTIDPPKLSLEETLKRLKGSL